MAATLARARGPVLVLIPRGGVSGLDVPGKAFHDPEADQALFEALATGLANSPKVRVEFRDEAINDSAFADAAARALTEMMATPKEK